VVRVVLGMPIGVRDDRYSEHGLPGAMYTAGASWLTPPLVGVQSCRSLTDLGVF
jgi:hypothetical protein